MRLVALSDLHGWLPADVPACDVLLLAGDVCRDFHRSLAGGDRRAAGLLQADWLRSRFAPWLAALDARAIVLCWGNHDFAGELPADLLPELPATILTDAGAEVQGLRIYATPWTFFMPDVWAFDVSPARLETYMHAIPDGLDVLVTHGPPYGVLDLVPGRGPAGSRALADAVARARPRIHVFGHIHEGRGREGSSWNVAVLDERYRPYERPLDVIDL